MNRAFRDRTEAGKALADRLLTLPLHDPVVLALPRGGVPVAAPVAQALKAPLDLVMVRKLGMPGHPELAAGAVVNGHTRQVVFNPEVLRQSGLTESDFTGAIEKQVTEIASRRARYLQGRAPVPVAERDAIVIDDGIATGATVRAALMALRAYRPRSIVLAIPVAPLETVIELSPLVDETVCLATPSPFYAVGMHYHRFDQVSDDEVVDLLSEANRSGMGGTA